MEHWLPCKQVTFFMLYCPREAKNQCTLAIPMVLNLFTATTGNPQHLSAPPKFVSNSSNPMQTPLTVCKDGNTITRTRRQHDEQQRWHDDNSSMVTQAMAEWNRQMKQTLFSCKWHSLGTLSSLGYVCLSLCLPVFNLFYSTWVSG